MVIIQHMSNTDGPSRMAPADRRDQIISVAAEHLTRRSITSVSMSDIARDAGVTRALVYHYFPGKEPLIEAVLIRESERLLQATEPDPNLSEGENLEKALRVYFDYFASRGQGIRDFYSAAISGNAVARETAARSHQVQIERVVRSLGEEPNDTVLLVVGGWLEFVAYVARQLPERPSLSREELITLCLRTLEAALSRPIRKNQE